MVLLKLLKRTFKFHLVRLIMHFCYHVYMICMEFMISVFIWFYSRTHGPIVYCMYRILVHNFCDWLDYCNILLYWLPKKTLHSLQIYQNYAARLILWNDKSKHITLALYYLHWLPVELHVDSKVLFYTFYDHSLKLRKTIKITCQVHVCVSKN